MIASAQAAAPHIGLAALHHELRFESLFHPGRALVFPCDAAGRVELDALSDRVRHNYLYARLVVGREYATPAVVAGRAARA